MTGEASFQHAKGFEAAVAAGFSARDQVFGGLVTAGLGHRDAMQSCVELAVGELNRSAQHLDD